jgi:hypothetical protein
MNMLQQLIFHIHSPMKAPTPTGGERCTLVLPVRYENENLHFFWEAFGRRTVTLNQISLARQGGTESPQALIKNISKRKHAKRKVPSHCFQIKVTKNFSHFKKTQF